MACRNARQESGGRPGRKRPVGRRTQGVAILLMLLLADTAAAREPLGVFGHWGAFRDAKPLRCYAIAEPEERPRGSGWAPFATIAHWPGRAVRNQLHIRLRKTRERGTPVTLTVDGRSFVLVAGRADAWAPDAAADAAILAAIRGGSEMRVAARGEDGRRFTDAYALRGAATAIDAAALACASQS